MITVIVPIYNTEKYLHECVDSILSQTYTDFELLLIDDGSTDRSGEICDEYSQFDSRVRVFHKKNGGVSSARNVGIEEARCEWIYFCDADDTLSDDTLDIFHKQCTEQVDMVMAGYRVVDENGNVERIVDRVCDEQFNRLQAMTEMFNPTDFVYQGYLWCKLFKASIIKDNKIEFCKDIYFNEDRLFIVDYLSHINRGVAYTTRSVYNYVERSSGTMASLKKGYNRKFVTDFDAFVLMKKIIKRLPEAKQLNPLVDKGIRDSYDWNHRLMYQFQDCSTHNHWHMVWGLVKTGLFLPYLKELLAPIMMLVIPQYFCRKKTVDW